MQPLALVVARFETFDADSEKSARFLKLAGTSSPRVEARRILSRVSFVSRQMPRYMALYSRNLAAFKRPLRSGMSGYMALYPGLGRKQPPIRFRQTGGGRTYAIDRGRE